VIAVLCRPSGAMTRFLQKLLEICAAACGDRLLQQPIVEIGVVPCGTDVARQRVRSEKSIEIGLRILRSRRIQNIRQIAGHERQSRRVRRQVDQRDLAAVALG
jgi:hypothetical protein